MIQIQTTTYLNDDGTFINSSTTTIPNFQHAIQQQIQQIQQQVQQLNQNMKPAIDNLFDFSDEYHRLSRKEICDHYSRNGTGTLLSRTNLFIYLRKVKVLGEVKNKTRQFIGIKIPDTNQRKATTTVFDLDFKQKMDCLLIYYYNPFIKNDTNKQILPIPESVIEDPETYFKENNPAGPKVDEIFDYTDKTAKMIKTETNNKI